VGGGSIILVVAAALAGLVGLALAYGAARWRQSSRQWLDRLASGQRPIAPVTVDFAELVQLPPPVQRYFRAVLRDGQPRITGVEIEHQGQLDLGESVAQWKPFTSRQRVILERPGFLWDARIAAAPGVAVRVHDGYAAGEGRLHASLLGLIPLADLTGPGEIARGELFRFLAEAAWYPTALLPSPSVRWQAVDEQSARVTLVDGDLEVTLLFHFDAAGRLETVRADFRGRTVQGRVEPTPWLGRFWNYEERGGQRIPLDGEVAWLLPTGPRPYWRGTIRSIHYDFAA
jgi:hypothetical protein